MSDWGFYAVSRSAVIFIVRMIVQLFSPPHLSPLTRKKGVLETYCIICNKRARCLGRGVCSMHVLLQPIG